MTSFAAMGQLAETEVYRAGEATARGNLLKGEDNFTNFRGKQCFEIKPYTLDVDGRTVDPLNRSRMIGDFFIVPYYGCVGQNNFVPRKGRTQVYCCESDRFETFGWEDVVHQSEVDDVAAAFATSGYPDEFEAPAPGPASLTDDVVEMPDWMFAEANVKKALMLGLKRHFADENLTQPTNPSQAAASFAKPLTAVGVPAKQATTAMIDTLHRTISEQIAASGHVTEEEIKNAPVEDLHDAFVQGGVPGGYLSVALDAVLPAAMRAATQSGAATNSAKKANRSGPKFEKEDGDHDLKRVPAMDLLCFRPFRQYTMVAKCCITAILILVVLLCF